MASSGINPAKVHSNLEGYGIDLFRLAEELTLSIRKELTDGPEPWFRAVGMERRYLCRNIRKVYIYSFVIALTRSAKILVAQQVNAA